MFVRTKSHVRALWLPMWLTSASILRGGGNQSGTLILHANPQLTYTSDHNDYCGQAGLAAGHPNLASGVYWLRLQCGTSARDTRIVVLRREAP